MSHPLPPLCLQCDGDRGGYDKSFWWQIRLWSEVCYPREQTCALSAIHEPTTDHTHLTIHLSCYTADVTETSQLKLPWNPPALTLAILPSCCLEDWCTQLTCSCPNKGRPSVRDSWDAINLNHFTPFHPSCTFPLRLLFFFVLKSLVFGFSPESRDSGRKCEPSDSCSCCKGQRTYWIFIRTHSWSLRTKICGAEKAQAARLSPSGLQGPHSQHPP